MGNALGRLFKKERPFELHCTRSYLFFIHIANATANIMVAKNNTIRSKEKPSLFSAIARTIDAAEPLAIILNSVRLYQAYCGPSFQKHGATIVHKNVFHHAARKPSFHGHSSTSGHATHYSFAPSVRSLLLKPHCILSRKNETSRHWNPEQPAFFDKSAGKRPPCGLCHLSL